MVKWRFFHLKLHHFNAVIYGPLSFEAFMVLHCQKGQKFLGSGETLAFSDLAVRVTCKVTLSSHSNSTINCSSKRKGALLSPASVTCRTIADWILVVRWFYFFIFSHHFPLRLIFSEIQWLLWRHFEGNKLHPAARNTCHTNLEMPCCLVRCILEICLFL